MHWLCGPGAVAAILFGPASVVVAQDPKAVRDSILPDTELIVERVIDDPCPYIESLEVICNTDWHLLQATVESDLPRWTRLRMVADDAFYRDSRVRWRGTARANWWNPMPGLHEVCIEECDICETVSCGCASDADCDDGEYCNGEEICDTVSGECISGEPPCVEGELCDEEEDTCFTNLDLGLVAYYPFEGSANDASGNENHGTIQGAVLCPDRNGVESAYCFDGAADQIDVPSSSSLELYDSITVAAWTRPESVPPARPYGTHAHILSKSNNDYYGGGRNYQIDLTRDPAFEAQGWFLFTGGTVGGCYTADSYSVSDWYHIVGVYDDQLQERRIYVNGQLSQVCSTTTQTAVTPNDAPLVIGGFGEVASHFFHFDGAIDEVRVYNRVLDDTEVEALFLLNP
jgi:hypothetical protein